MQLPSCAWRRRKPWDVLSSQRGRQELESHRNTSVRNGERSKGPEVFDALPSTSPPLPLIPDSQWKVIRGGVASRDAPRRLFRSPSLRHIPRLSCLKCDLRNVCFPFCVAVRAFGCSLCLFVFEAIAWPLTFALYAGTWKRTMPGRIYV